MELEKAKVIHEDENKAEKLKLIGLIMEPYVKVHPEEVCGDKFNALYEKSLSELKIYYQVFK